MYAVGKVGTYIAQGVYTVSGPFHPFGGAVDIIAVQQEDGTFKSSPWYVKFGKFQGVLKRREKKVFVAVNDGDASFHMYLDHKGEAYFLRDAQGDDEVGAISPTEAASSGDEGSSRILALEYPKVEERSDARAEPSKEASEDEKGDDPQLQLRGREASKLIQESAEAAVPVSLAITEIDALEGNLSTDAASTGSVGDTELSPKQNAAKTVTHESVSHGEKAGSNGRVLQTFLTKSVGLETVQGPTLERALVPEAAVSALKSALKPEGTGRKTASSNGVVIHRLLNLAVGLPASQNSGPATALVASAARASLERVLCDSESNVFLVTPGSRPKLVEVSEIVSNAEGEKRHFVGSSSAGELSGEQENVVAGKSVVIPTESESITGCIESADDGILKTSLHGLEVISGRVGEVCGPTAQSVDIKVSIKDTDLASATVFDIPKSLEVRKLEVLEEGLAVLVQDHDGEETAHTIAQGEQRREGFDVSIGISGKVGGIVIDRKQMVDKIQVLRDSSARDVSDGGIESNNVLKPIDHENLSREQVHQQVTDQAAKQLVESSNDVLLPNVKQRSVSMQEEKDVALSRSENVVVVDSPEVANVGEEIAGLQAVNSQDVLTADDELSVFQAVNSPDVVTAGEELKVPQAVNFPDVGSPRLKADINLEMAWREVMDRATAALKDAPYSRKRLDDRRSLEKRWSASSGSVQKKPDSMDGLPEPSERKSWGGWFWGQPKQTSEQNTSKDVKNVQKDLSMEASVSDLDNHEVGDQSVGVSDAEDVTKNRTCMKHGGGSDESGNSKAEAAETSLQSSSSTGSTLLTGLPSESGKYSNENGFPKGKVDDPVESMSERKSQQKVQGVPQPRRRFFGILSRPTTNQSPLPNVPLVLNIDEVPSTEVVLKRETSLERAESVVDLLDAKWATGSKGAKALMAVGRALQGTNAEDEGLMAIAGPDGAITEEKMNCQTEVSGVRGENAVLTTVEKSMTGEKTEVNTLGNIQTDDQRSSPLVEGIDERETVVRHLVNKSDENSNVHMSEDEQGTETQQAGQEYADGNQTKIEVAMNGLEVEDDTSSALVSDSSLKVPISSQGTEMVLMSIDGYVVRAPILPLNSEPPQASRALCGGYDENVNSSRQSSSSPEHAILFPGNSKGMPGSSPHDLVMFSEHQMQQLESECSGEVDKEFDRSEPDDFIRYRKTTSSCEGSMKLPVMVAFDSAGSSQSNLEASHALDSDLLTSKCTHGVMGPSLGNGSPVQKSSDNRGSADTADGKDFEEMRSSIFQGLDETGDGCDLQLGEIECYYSSKDLQEIDNVAESKVFRRNMSIYMDAISGEEDEAEMSSFALDYDRDQSTEQSSPIVIPGALERTQNSLSLVDDDPILRIGSESLPNVRQHVTNSDVSSSRFVVSRSLDSQPVGITFPRDMKDMMTSFDRKVTPVASVDTPVKGLEKESDDVLVTGRMTEKVNVEQLNEGTHQASSDNRMTTTSSSSMDENEKVPETGFELSLCRHLLTEKMGLEAAAKVFASARVTLDEFKNSGSAIAANDKLVVKLGGRYYRWVVAAPIVLGILAFGQVLTAPNEGDIPVDQPDVVVDGKGSTSTGALSTLSSGGWKLWPFGSIRRPKTPESGSGGVLISRDALMVATEAALKGGLGQEYMMNGYYKKPRKVRTNNPNSEQLQSLNLREGSNKITFTFETPLLGKQQVDARIYLWKWNTRIVISDVDGTITKSDVLGQVMPLVGKDWTQSGVARLFSAIKKNGYELMFLSARAISQAYLTRQFLENIRQDGEVLPDGPVVISPDGLFPSLYREVIRRAPHEFKIACLEDIKSLFPPESKPFYAGFGNRDTDELSYLKVGISKGKIFIINPKGEVVVNNQVDTKTYTSLHKLVDDMFPAMTFTEQEDYNEWNFWKLPLPDIEDEPSIKSSGSSTSKRVGKSGRHS